MPRRPISGRKLTESGGATRAPSSTTTFNICVPSSPALVRRLSSRLLKKEGTARPRTGRRSTTSGHVKRSWAEASVYSRRRKNRRVRPREKDPFVAVVLPSNAIRRFAAFPFDFENHCVTVWHTDTTTTHDQSITYCCTQRCLLETSTASNNPAEETSAHQGKSIGCSFVPARHTVLWLARVQPAAAVVFEVEDDRRGFEPDSVPAGAGATSHRPATFTKVSSTNQRSPTP